MGLENTKGSRSALVGSVGRRLRTLEMVKPSMAWPRSTSTYRSRSVPEHTGDAPALDEPHSSQPWQTPQLHSSS